LIALFRGDNRERMMKDEKAEHVEAERDLEEPDVRQPLNILCSLREAGRSSPTTLVPEM
jgi:hypothetical protein